MQVDRDTGTVKPVLSSHSKRRPKIGFQDQLPLNAGQKYCRMLHSAILLTFVKLPLAIKVFVLSIFEWPLKAGFTVCLFFSARQDFENTEMVTTCKAFKAWDYCIACNFPFTCQIGFGFQDTVQSLYNTPCFTRDLDITGSRCGSQIFCHGIL